MSIDYLKRSGWKPGDAEKLAKSNLFAGINTVNDVAYRGILAPLLGIAPDMYNLAENAYRGGRNLLTGSHLPEAPPPHGGSEWWGNEMQKAGLVSDKRRPLMELLAGFVDPATAGAGVVKTAPVMKGIFAGIKAQGAKLDLLEKAKKMMAEGATDKDAWQETGWTHGFADKMPRFEIDDSGMTLKQSLSDNLSNKQNIQEFWGHPELYSNYPESAHIKFMPTDSEKAGSGSYGNNLIKLGMDGFSSTPRDSVTAHELQHYTQGVEGFARGGQPGANGLSWDELNNIASDLYSKSQDSGGDELLSALFDGAPPLKNWADLSNQDKIPWQEQAQKEIYNRLAGESESRLVEKRLNMTPAERAASYPVDMFDVPVKDQIVRFGNNGPSMAIAYHGSPHKLDKFNMSKIGTGEGAQAYGHGLYFADSPDVATEYQKKNVFRAFDIPEEAEKRGITLNAGGRGEFVRQAASTRDSKEAAKYLQYANIEARESDAEKIASMIDDYRMAQQGNLYKVDIDDNAIANMLDWDKPLSEQKTQGHKSLVQYLKDIGAGGENLTGEEAYKQLMFQSRMEGIASDSAAKRMNIEQMEASRRLNEFGIPGIRYLDQGSRDAGQGTRNTVLFDDSLVKILERNGIPIKADPLSALQSAAQKQGFDPSLAQMTPEGITYPDEWINSIMGDVRGDVAGFNAERAGLPAGHSRMDRSILTGHDTNVYHGTDSDITSIDPSKFGLSTGSNSAKRHFWAVDDPTTARGYAEYAAKDAKVKKLLDAADNAEKRGKWDLYDQLLGDAETLESANYNQPNLGQNIMPLLLNTKNSKSMDAGGAEYVDLEGGVNKFLSSLGTKNDVGVINNLADDVGLNGRAATHYAIKNPSKVRSIFAQFDPLKKNSGNLLASILAGMTIAAQDDKKKSDKKKEDK